MTKQSDLEVEDRTYYAVFANQVRGDMIHAHSCAQCLAEQIEPLVHATELPARLRVAYAEMHARLVEVATLADRVIKKYSHKQEMLDLGFPKSHSEPTEELLNAVMAGIRLLDEVEGRNRKTFDELRNRLEKPNRSTLEWKDVSIEAIVTLYMEPSPERKIYSALLEPVYFRTLDSFAESLHDESCDSCLLGDGANWEYQFQPNHPLGGTRCGYLLYSFLEVEHLPWFMLGQIRDVEVEWRIRGGYHHGEPLVPLCPDDTSCLR